MATAKPKEVDAKPIDEEEVPKKKSKKMLFIIMGILILLLGGGGAYYFLMMQKDPEQSTEEKKVVEPKAPIYVVLDPFTANLSGGGQYLQMAVSLQMKDEKGGARLKAYLPSVRSRILLLISSKTAEEITNEEGKLKLKLEIKETIEKPFAEGALPIEIFEVLITAFVIQ